MCGRHRRQGASRSRKHIDDTTTTTADLHDDDDEVRFFLWP